MKWLSPKDKKRLDFVPNEVDEARPSFSKADEVRVQGEEETAAETSARAKGKAPKVEEEVPTTANPILDEDETNAKAEPERRRSKHRQSSPKTPMDKPKVRKMTKKLDDTINLSDDEPQEAKRKEETLLAKVTSLVPKVDVIENFRKSMIYGK
ncbi:hypothetical protein R1flu_005731 [Riccia fluitans]|uniref:Uncharacterized protein n=1 Tax=Riccia fluitans TaxID=41844 RepID=A0ABD1YXZ2_9MARC